MLVQRYPQVCGVSKVGEPENTTSTGITIEAGPDRSSCVRKDPVGALGAVRHVRFMTGPARMTLHPTSMRAQVSGSNGK